MKGEPARLTVENWQSATSVVIQGFDSRVVVPSRANQPFVPD